jgi:hypothetical protein
MRHLTFNFNNDFLKDYQSTILYQLFATNTEVIINYMYCVKVIIQALT